MTVDPGVDWALGKEAILKVENKVLKLKSHWIV